MVRGRLKTQNNGFQTAFLNLIASAVIRCAEGVPYGAAAVGQGRACAEDAAAVVAGAVEIAARAGQQAVEADSF